MAYKEIFPQNYQSRLNTKAIVRVSFPYIKVKSVNVKKVVGNSMTMYIGKEVADVINIQGGDRVKFFVDSRNPRIWFIKKSTDGIGYKVAELRRQTDRPAGCVRLHMTWNEFTPEDAEISLRTVKHEISDGGLKITLPNENIGNGQNENKRNKLPY